MKINRPSESASPGKGRRIPVRIIAREKRETAYIQLKCGHLTHYDTQEQYVNFRPKGKTKYFCETCGKWQFPLTKYKRKDILPDEPPF